MFTDSLELSEYQRDPRKHQFYPYADNGGTTVAVAGDDFVMVGSDMRLTGRASILSRAQTKIFQLSSNTVLASTGCWADVLTLQKELQARFTMYSQEHNDEMTCTAIAQLVSTLLYWRRFFPYYVSNMVVGLDEEGHGAVYHYDPVGHMEKVRFSAAGASVAQIQPLLDNQLGALNMKDTQPPKVTKALAHQLIHDAFISAAERDVNTGDACTIYTITKDGIAEEEVPLRRD